MNFITSLFTWYSLEFTRSIMPIMLSDVDFFLMSADYFIQFILKTLSLQRIFRAMKEEMSFTFNLI